MDNVKVSIITVSYNSEKTIGRTIESVLHQTYENIEYIIVDGASNDGTVDIIKSYEKDFGNRLKWISKPDDGIYYAMNKGINMATGDIIGIINSDDWYEEDAVENIISVYDPNEYQIIYGMLNTWDNGKLLSVEWRNHEYLRSGMIGHPACFVTKNIYNDIGSFDTEYRSVADYDFMLRMSVDNRVVFTPIMKVIANFSTGGMCSSSQAWRELLKLQRAYDIISDRQYKITILKDNIYRVLHRK